jgi:hypothetical protein
MRASRWDTRERKGRDLGKFNGFHDSLKKYIALLSFL